MPHDFCFVHLPYSLKRLEDGRYVVLNRGYKPIGFQTNEKVDYTAYPIAVKFKGLTVKVAAKISVPSSENLENIFLYDSHSIPTVSSKNMQDYLKRLEVLAKLKIEES
jgi:hypothetical protein